MITNHQYKQIKKICRTEHRKLITEVHAAFLVSKVLNNDDKDIDPRQIGGTVKEAVIWAYGMLGNKPKAAAIATFLDMDFRTVVDILYRIKVEVKKTDKEKNKLLPLTADMARDLQARKNHEKALDGQ